MADLVLFSNPMSRGRIARWMIEETGAPYDLRIMAFQDLKSKDYKALNPMGKVPTLVHGETVVTECAAICAYLADTFPEAGLGPRPEERGAYYRWLFFAAGPLEAAVTNKALGFQVAPEQSRMAGYGSYADVMDTLEQAVSKHAFHHRRTLHGRRRLCRLPHRMGPAIRVHREAAGFPVLLRPPVGASRTPARE